LLIAQTIERKDVSVLAQLAVCQGVLTKQNQAQPEEKAKESMKIAIPDTPEPPENQVKEGAPRKSPQPREKKKPPLQSILTNQKGKIG
jgi:hypothetical protein